MAVQTTPCLVCAASSFPTYNDIFSQFKDLKVPFDPKIPGMPAMPTLPKLPSMPSPMFPTMTLPEYEKSNLASSLVLNQILNWFKELIAKLKTFVPSMPSVPNVPHLDLTLDQITEPSFDLAAFIANLKVSMPEINFSVPMLPDPVLKGMDFPEFEYVAKVQSTITNYCTTLIDYIINALGQVVNKLNIKPFQLGLSLPSFPSLPTSFDELMSPMYSAIDVPDYEKFIAKYKDPNFSGKIPSLSALFTDNIPAAFSLGNLSVPDPILGNMRSVEFEVVELSKNYYMAMVSAIGKTIDFFTNSFASIIGFGGKLVCVSVPVA